MMNGMCTKLPRDTQEERLRWVLPIVKKETKIKDVVKVFPYSQRTLERWVASFRKEGRKGLIPKSTRPKSNPKETPIGIKEEILALRRKAKLSALKLAWKVKKEGITIHPRTIGKFLKQEGLVRKYRPRKIKYQYLKIPLAKGELVEIDIRYVPKKVEGKKYYQFTAIDCASRWRYLKIYDQYSNWTSIDFFKTLIRSAPFQIKAIKTDNASYFTNRYIDYKKSSDPLNPRIHSFDREYQKNNIIHYLIDPGKPQQNGKVERSHRTDKECFYQKINFRTITFEELVLKLKLWNSYYNDLEHCALNGKTPNEMLQLT